LALTLIRFATTVGDSANLPFDGPILSPAMAQHAAPTSVTVAAHQEETALQLFVKRYWLPFSGLAAVLIAIILFTQLQREESKNALGESWAPLVGKVNFGGIPSQNGMPDMQPFVIPAAGVLAGLSADLGDGPAAPWVKALEAGRLLRDDDNAGALAASQEIAATWPNHPLATMRLPFSPDGEAQPLAKHIETRLQEVAEWEAAHPDLFANPAPVTDSPTVTLNTNKGAITLGFYPSKAPLHVENFLSRCESGGYDGTKFHRVNPGRSIHAGDPNSVDGEPETWGLGGGDGTIEHEDSGLHHFSYVLGMDFSVGTTESNTGLFYITIADQFHLDGGRTSFGVVTEGQAVLDAIATGPLDGLRPQDPVIIESTTVSR
jgi:peptidyl-prolyl cis-trans isomerase B (cyclophilin B)